VNVASAPYVIDWLLGFPPVAIDTGVHGMLTVIVFVNVGAEFVEPFAAFPTTVLEPLELVTTAPVNVAVPLALALTLPAEMVLPGVDEKAVPPRVVEPAVKNGALIVAEDRLTTVITGLMVAPAAWGSLGGAMPVISSE
jgi:hypothetical protein